MTATNNASEKLLLDNIGGLLNLHTDKNSFCLNLDNQAKVKQHRAAHKLVAETLIHRLEREGESIYILKSLAAAYNELAQYRTAQVFIDRALDLAQRDKIATQDSIVFMMTDRCNLRCKHCFIFNEAVFKPVGRAAELAPLDYVRILQSLQRSERQFAIHITGGGEVFARTDLEQIVYCLSLINDGNFRFPVSMQTNGHFPERLETVLKDSPKLFHTIQFSMDGLEETHNAVRGQYNWAKLIESIAITRKAGVEVNIITTILPENVNRLEELRDFCHSIGVKHHRFQLFFEGSKIALSPEDMRKAAPFITERDRSLVYHDAFAPGHGCLAGIRTCIVRPDGSIETCRESYSGNVPRMKIVNLRDYEFDFLKAMASAEAFDELRKVKNCLGCAAFCDR